MEQRNPLHGCIASILFVTLITLAVVGGCSFVSYNVANIADSIGETRQNTVSEVQTTKRTDIEWSARVEMERIKADATKKTSMKFSVFFVVRFALWFIILYAGYLAWEKWRSDGTTTTAPVDG